MTHAIMFHHFHDARHPEGQGSISCDDFNRMLDYLDDNLELLGAKEFSERVLSGGLNGNEACLTFDDSLKCQHDIALPVLQERSISAFFFVYTSVFTDKPEMLEIYRNFRNIQFDSMDNFYTAFFHIFNERHEQAYASYMKTYPDDYLSTFSFYTENDRRFRYVRDNVLSVDQYHELMWVMMSNARYDIKKASHDLWMSEDDLLDIEDKGHVIGLHSHTHPTAIDQLDIERQRSEYEINKLALSRILQQDLWAMSHPCGRYNKDTLDVLGGMGIRIGFRSSMSETRICSSLEIPRDDHANLLKSIR